jgi:molybdopterin molybdotransferase
MTDAPVVTVEEARGLVLGRVSRLSAEEVALSDALGRVLAADARSDIDVAPFDNSAMDGFAVRVADLAGASPQSPIPLSVIAHIGAGDDVAGIIVGTGQAARIMTGAAMPEGADTVVKVELTRVLAGDGGIGSSVAFELEPPLGENVRRRGEEVMAGDVVLPSGSVLGPAAIGLLAATGNATVSVYRRPRVAVLSTGSELVDVVEKPGPGKIRDSNSYSIAAQVIAAGGLPVRYDTVVDDMAATRSAFTLAAEECDFIVVSGGVSVGDFDYVKPVLAELGELIFCKVDMRPGNPQTMGSIGNVPFFGLPGNPTSTYVGFEVFVRPCLRIMQGLTAIDRPTTLARLAHDVRKRQGRRYYLRGRVERAADGDRYVASLPESQSSALLMAAHHGNCLVMLPEGPGEFPAGALVECMRLDMEEGTS